MREGRSRIRPGAGLAGAGAPISRDATGQAICPRRRVRGRPAGPSRAGERSGALSWPIAQHHADGTDLSGLRTALPIRYLDRVPPSTPAGRRALRRRGRRRAAGRAGRPLPRPGRGDGRPAVRPGQRPGLRRPGRPLSPLEHAAARTRTDAAGSPRVEAPGDTAGPGDVRRGIPGLDHLGTEPHDDAPRATDPAPRRQIRGRRHAALTTGFDDRSGP